MWEGTAVLEKRLGLEVRVGVQLVQLHIPLALALRDIFRNVGQHCLTPHILSS